MQLEQSRRSLVTQILHDWDQVTPIHAHIQSWQLTLDDYKYQLLAAALGGRRRTADVRISPQSILRWAKQLNIEIREPDPRRHFLDLLLRDWDQTRPLKHHAEEWQDLSNPFKYQLVVNTLGGRFRNRPIEYTTIRAWIRDLKIKVPTSRRTATPSKRTLARWKRMNLSGGSSTPMH